MAVLAIDGPGQGEMEFRHPMRHDYEVPVGCAIDYFEGRTDVNATRVGLMGVSLGPVPCTRYWAEAVHALRARLGPRAW